jgi:Leucine-rich repeat (LRR) protein
MKERLNPRASLIVRQNFSTHLNLAHMGIGDRLAKLLSSCLSDLPDIKAIDITDNNLTDNGLAPLISSLMKMRCLTYLDLSHNKLGK